MACFPTPPYSYMGWQRFFSLVEQNWKAIDGCSARSSHFRSIRTPHYGGVAQTVLAGSFRLSPFPVPHSCTPFRACNNVTFPPAKQISPRLQASEVCLEIQAYSRGRIVQLLKERVSSLRTAKAASSSALEGNVRSSPCQYS